MILFQISHVGGALTNRGQKYFQHPGVCVSRKQREVCGMLLSFLILNIDIILCAFNRFAYCELFIILIMPLTFQDKLQILNLKFANGITSYQKL